MKLLFDVNERDRGFYQDRLRSFLPDRIIDIHTHVWKKELIVRAEAGKSKTVSWPSLVAEENPIEDLLATYELMFPGKQVKPLIFSTLSEKYDELNAYVAECAEQARVPSLIFSRPQWEADDFEQRIMDGGFLGAKSYLTAADSSIPVKEITIFDFFPHHQLEIMNKHGWIMMLHIPRDLRLRDPINLEQMLEIDRRYPDLQCIIAHVGRAYCDEDLGDAMAQLAGTVNLKFDISANTNAHVFEELIKTVGSDRILFGSDMPILRMRMKRITRDGIYVNVVPKGLYGDISGDANMDEVEGDEAEALTFFMYQEIDAFRRAAEVCQLKPADIEKIFCANAEALLARAGWEAQ
ncbi:amidohydrolase family protein [Planctomycetota bacterium]